MKSKMRHSLHFLTNIKNIPPINPEKKSLAMSKELEKHVEDILNKSSIIMETNKNIKTFLIQKSQEKEGYEPKIQEIEKIYGKNVKVNNDLLKLISTALSNFRALPYNDKNITSFLRILINPNKILSQDFTKIVDFNNFTDKLIKHLSNSFIVENQFPKIINMDFDESVKFQTFSWSEADLTIPNNEEDRIWKFGNHNIEELKQTVEEIKTKYKFSLNCRILKKGKMVFLISKKDIYKVDFDKSLEINLIFTLKDNGSNPNVRDIKHLKNKISFRNQNRIFIFDCIINQVVTILEIPDLEEFLFLDNEKIITIKYNKKGIEEYDCFINLISYKTFHKKKKFEFDRYVSREPTFDLFDNYYDKKYIILVFNYSLYLIDKNTLEMIEHISFCLNEEEMEPSITMLYNNYIAYYEFDDNNMLFIIRDLYSTKIIYKKETNDNLYVLTNDKKIISLKYIDEVNLISKELYDSKYYIDF